MLGSWLERKRLFLLYRIDGASVGDVVTATGFMRGVHGLTGRRFLVVSKYPDIFQRNPLVERHLSIGELGAVSKPLVKAILRHAKHPNVGEYGYRARAGSTEADIARDHQRRVSEMQFCSEALAQRWQVALDYSALRPEIHLSRHEREEFGRKHALAPQYWVVRPVGQTSYTPNKEWGFERFQEVLRRTPRIHWVQIGSAKDPLLAGARDLRGRTTLRELFCLIAGAQGVLSGEGLPNHVAAAFGIPSVVVFTGFSHAELATYPNTVAIRRIPQVACAPCWKLSPCPVAGMPCASDITAEQVTAEVEKRSAGA